MIKITCVFEIKLDWKINNLDALLILFIGEIRYRKTEKIILFYFFVILFYFFLAF